MRRVSSISSLAAALVLGIGSVTAVAEDPLSEFDAAATISVAALVNQPLPRRFCLDHALRAPLAAPLERRLRGALPGLAPTPVRAGIDVEMSDSTLVRLLRKRRLELLHLLETDSTRLFFGVSARGHVGVHIDATALIAPD